MEDVFKKSCEQRLTRPSLHESRHSSRQADVEGDDCLAKKDLGLQIPS